MRQADSTIERAWGNPSVAGGYLSILGDSDRDSAQGRVEPVGAAGGYLRAARACLPRWLHILERPPWVPTSRKKTALNLSISAVPLYYQQAATLAVALLCEKEGNQPDTAYLRDIVRTSLIRWQATLTGGGFPADRKLRKSMRYGATVALVVQLLEECSGYETDLLLTDLARHMDWVAKRPKPTSWIEAATICAMADSAVVLREGSLLRRARHRLDSLLRKQTEEGWFPERGGSDLGRLSLTADSLARLYHRNGWDELREPIQRSLKFLAHFVHEDGIVGGCVSSCGTAFVSPYGVELMADTIPSAAEIAQVCRGRFASFPTRRLPAWHDELCCILGPGLVHASLVAGGALSGLSPNVEPVIEEKCFSHAGLFTFATEHYHAVVCGRNGGALYVTWRKSGKTLDDPGLVVLFPHRFRTSSRPNPRTLAEVTPDSVTSSGVLQRPFRASRSRGRRLKRWWHKRSRVRDTFRREIRFGKEWIRIRDVVCCFLPCQTIILPCSTRDRGHHLVDHTVTSGPGFPPIIVEGGRYVEITRVYRNGELVEPHIFTDGSKQAGQNLDRQDISLL